MEIFILMFQNGLAKSDSPKFVFVSLGYHYMYTISLRKDSKVLVIKYTLY